MKLRLAITLAAISMTFIFQGCESYRETMHGISHGLGGIEISDIQQQNSLRQTLPNYLGLPENKIQIEAGSGVTHVTISGVNADDKQSITNKIQNLQIQNPNMNPIRLHFD